jgi:hypothetical protein
VALLGLRATSQYFEARHNDERTTQSQGREEKARYDTERKESRQEDQKGIQGFARQ